MQPIKVKDGSLIMRAPASVGPTVRKFMLTTFEHHRKARATSAHVCEGPRRCPHRGLTKYCDASCACPKTVDWMLILCTVFHIIVPIFIMNCAHHFLLFLVVQPVSPDCCMRACLPHSPILNYRHSAVHNYTEVWSKL